jgi:hypothetical protein
MVNYYFHLKRGKSKVNRPPSIAFGVGSKRTQSTIVGGVEEFSIKVSGFLVSGKGLLHEEAPMYKHRLRCLVFPL